MTGEAILVITFIFSFVLGVLLAGGIETLIKRKKAHKRYLKRLEEENKRLKRVVNLYELELQTREVKK